MTPPILTTQRLILRGPRAADADAYAELWGDPIVTRYIGGVPLPRDEAWQRLLRSAGHWALLGCGSWIVEAAESGRLLGEVGFLDLRRATEPSFHGVPEIGWVLAPSAHGRGLGTEAVRAALDWGRERFGAVRCVCMIDADNAASLRLARAQGFADAGSVTHRGRQPLLLDRLL